MKKLKSFIFVVSLFAMVATQQASINPLSKITITSKRASCQKDKAQPQFFIFNYHDNVVVTFADKSTITTDQLEVIFEGKDLEKQLTTRRQSQRPTAATSAKPLEKFKKVTASGNVVLTSQNRTATAQTAELLLAQHLCTLNGNVTIQQKKTSPKDFPITIQSNQATINLQTDELLFTGTEATPVNTVISLEDYEPLHKKSKKTKFQHKQS